MAQSPISVLVDPSAAANTGSPAPATNRPGSPLYTATAQPQGGVLNLGSDYASPANAQAMRTDAYGNQYIVSATPIGTAAVVAQASAPASSYYGMPVMLRQDLAAPTTWQSLTGDALGSLQVHERSKPTFRFVAPAVAGATGKSMMSIINGSSASLVRIQTCIVQTPYVYQTGGSIAGLIGTYNLSLSMIHEMRRITGQTGGTSITAASCDSADTLPSGIVCMTGGTLSGAASAPFYRCDANNTDGQAWYIRGNANEKTLVLRPGEGMSITSISNTANFTFDVESLVTVAAG